MSAELVEAVGRAWGLQVDDAADLGGSVNLNLRIDAGGVSYVARVHRPSTGPDRLAFVRGARARLRAGGVPCAESVPTKTQEPWVRLGDRLVELEEFVAATGRMNTTERVRQGLPTLGRCHTLLADAQTSAGAEPVYANYVSAADALAATKRAANRIRSWTPTSAEVVLAAEAERLAEQVAELEALVEPAEAQLVHGDFWDDNVLFDDDEVALVADLDFAGFRPRVDDLALTLYFTSVDLEDLTSNPARLRSFVDAYDEGVGAPLTERERSQLPAAMVRQPLWSVAVWVGMLDDADAARAHLRASAAEIRWGLETIERLPRLQDELVR